MTVSGQRPKVAVIDVGSNSIKLLVASAEAAEGPIDAEFAETVETRISAGIGGENPRLSDRAIQAGAEAIAELARQANTFEPEAVEIVATSAVRDASNGDVFLDRVRAHTGIRPRLLGGLDEARLIGAGLACDPRVPTEGPFFQVDLGGGSLEMIAFNTREIGQVVSLPLGAVRLAERFLRDSSAPMEADEERALRACAREALEASGFDGSSEQGPMIATGGAFVIARAVLAHREGLGVEEASPEMRLETLAALGEELRSRPLRKRLEIPHLPAARADVMPAALLVIEELMRFTGRDAAVHSFHNLRYGVARKALTRLMQTV